MSKIAQYAYLDLITERERKSVPHPKTEEVIADAMQELRHRLCKYGYTNFHDGRPPQLVLDAVEDILRATVARLEKGRE